METKGSSKDATAAPAAPSAPPTPASAGKGELVYRVRTPIVYRGRHRKPGEMVTLSPADAENIPWAVEAVPGKP